MGADIYLESASNKQEALWRPLFDAAVQARNKGHAQARHALYQQVRLLLSETNDPDLASLYEGRDTGDTLQSMQVYVDLADDKMHDDAGYYRDSYNGSNLLWLLGLDYWVWFSELLDGTGYLPLDAAAEARKEIASRKAPRLTIAKCKEMHLGVDKGENTPASWQAYFVKKQQALLKLLDRSIALGEPLRCSF